MTFYRVVFEGTFSFGDIWTTSFGVDDQGLSSAQDVADGIKSSYDGAKTWLTENLTGADSISRIVAYKTPTIGQPATEVAEATIGESGTISGTSVLPPQCSAVVSLRTGVPGRARRGRMYLPLRNNSDTDGDGKLETDKATAIANEVAAFFGSFNSILSGRRVVVLSGTLQQAFPVTSVDVGNIVDTQRRRRNAVPETRFSVDVSGV